MIMVKKSQNILGATLLVAKLLHKLKSKVRSSVNVPKNITSSTAKENAS
jgi:hypothetical protein